MKLVNAYDEVSLSHQSINNSKKIVYQDRVYNDTVQGSGYPRYGENNKRLPTRNNIVNGGRNYSGNSMSNVTYTKNFRTPQNEKYNHEHDNITETSKKTEKLSDVFTQSDDTTEFIKNLKTVIGSSIPDFLYYLILFCLSVFGVNRRNDLSIFASIRCCIEPRRQVQLRKMKALNEHIGNRGVLGEVCIGGINVILFIVIVVWTILGCIWVLGNIQYVHYNQGMFEEHYCDVVLYRTALTSVILYLTLFATLLLSMAGLMCYGLSKTK
uniref:Claudin-like protein n=1 Tax=Strongyloides stercoralis TaxID=6248 RepID=A0A0K0DX76_STRER